MVALNTTLFLSVPFKKVYKLMLLYSAFMTEDLTRHLTENAPYKRVTEVRRQPHNAVYDGYEIVLSCQVDSSKVAHIAFHVPKIGGDLTNYRFKHVNEDPLFISNVLDFSRQVARYFGGNELVIDQSHLRDLKNYKPPVHEMLHQQGLRSNSGSYFWSLK